MLRVKRVIIHKSDILVNDENGLHELKNLIATAMDVTPSQIHFTHTEVKGDITEDDQAVSNLKQIKLDE